MTTLFRIPSLLQFKRRSAGGAAGAPSAGLQQAEPFYNETDGILYLGVGAANPVATPIAGPGFAVPQAAKNAPSGVAGLGQYGELHYGTTTSRLILTATSTAGAAARATADGNAVAGGGANSIPIPLNSAMHIDGKWLAKNLTASPPDSLRGTFSIAVQRGTGAPAVPGSGVAFVSIYDPPSTGSLANAPAPTVAIDAANGCLALSYPGYGGLSIAVSFYDVSINVL